MRNPTLKISLEPKDFSLISRAAEIVDMSVESFVVMAVLSRSKDEIAEQRAAGAYSIDINDLLKMINDHPDLDLVIREPLKDKRA